MKLFLLRFRTLKLLLIEEKQWGIVPFIELLDRSRTPRDVALHIDSRFAHAWNLVLERDKKVLAGLSFHDKSSAGITELKLFLDKSK